MAKADYGFATDGIGNIIKQSLLKVPVNQRPYAWKLGHVDELLDDIKEAMSDGSDAYFLGTVVLVDSDSGRKLIADGQQRIATTSIILARCRDLLRSLNEIEDANAIETEFLRRYVRKSKDFEFLLTMNVEDDLYFKKIIIDKDWAIGEPDQPDSIYPSNERLFQASQAALSYLSGEIGHLSSKNAVDALNRWADFLKERASVVAVTVSDEVGAFRMFETLNDRGLRASQADILKNYLFSRVDPSDLDQIQAQWNQMYGALADRFDDADEQMIKYLKYFWILGNGLTRDRELAANIKKKVKKPRQAIDFVTDANSAVADYVAIFNSQDAKWKSHGQGVRDDLQTLTSIIGIEQIVPLVFAVSNKFDPIETKKACQLFVAWSVRFILGGTGRAGRLDKQYADLANEVGCNRIRSAKELRERMAIIYLT